MNKKLYIHYTKILFGAVFLMHGLRIIKDWNLAINGAPVPMWVSWIAVALTGYLAYSAHNLRK